MRWLIYSPCFWSAMVLCSGMYPGCLPFGWFLILLLFWHTLHLMLDFYLHHNVTTWPIFDLQLCLNVDILPWANYSSPGIIFFSVYEKNHTLLCLLLDSNTTQSSRWLLLGPLTARLPSSGAPAGQSNWCISLGCHWQRKSTHRRVFFFTDSLQLLHFDQNSKQCWQTFWILVVVRPKVYSGDTSSFILTASTESEKWSWRNLF